mgnify:CR=1 FL=1
MKKLINKFAWWLYNKTKEPSLFDGAIGGLYGYRVFQTKFMPKGTVYFGTGEPGKDFVGLGKITNIKL